MPLAAEDLEFYRDVYPFLKVNCVSCHNKTTAKARLNMETPALMKKGGDSGPAITPGNGAASLVVMASAHTKDMEMPPPNNKSGAMNLSPHQIAVLKQWIDQGAKSEAREEERNVVWRPLAPGAHPIYTVAMTKDGRYAACGRANRIFVYDLATRQLVAQITDPAENSAASHRALVHSLAFSPDGRRLASGSFREVKIWRLEPAQAGPGSSQTATPAPVSDALIAKITGAGKVAVLSHAASADGKQIVTGCADGSVRIWDAGTLQQVADLRGSVASSRHMAQLDWTIAAQGVEQAFQKSAIARIESQNKALDELLRKANEAIAAMQKALPEKQKVLKPAQDARAEAQNAADDAAAKVTRVSGGKPDPVLEKELKDAQVKLLAAKTAETSALAAVSATESNLRDAEADVKRITDSKARNAKDLANADAAAKRAKTAQDQAAASLVSAKQALTKPGAKPLAVAFSTDRQRAAAMFDDGSLRVWAVATGTPIEEAGGSGAATAVLTAKSDGSFAATRGPTLTAGAAPRWVLERTLGASQSQRPLFADRVNAVRFSPDNRTLATGGGELSRSGDVILFDVTSGRPVKIWNDRHDDAVLCLDFSPDGKLLASGASDKIAKVTDLATGRQVNLFEGHTHHVTGVAFRADGRVLATAGADGIVITWDMILGERRKKIEGWTKEVTSLQFIGATNQIVTSAGDNLIRIVNDEGAEIRAISKLPDFMQAAASTPGGGTIIGGGEDSILRVWDGSNGKELVAFEAR